MPVTVLTCTRGERGDVIPEDLRHLEGDLRALADHRETELADAMAALGVTDHRFLGDADARWRGLEPRRYVDSGMEWGEDGVPVALRPLDPDSLCAGDEADEARDVLAVIADVDATSVVTYDDHGGYGHPDHVRTHVIATWAAEEAGIPAYLITTTASSAREAHDLVAARGRFPAPDADPAGTLVLPDEAVDLRVDASAVLDRKIRAVAAHRTQTVVDGDQFALSHGIGAPIAAVEMYRLHHPSAPRSRTTAPRCPRAAPSASAPRPPRSCSGSSSARSSARRPTAPPCPSAASRCRWASCSPSRRSPASWWRSGSCSSTGCTRSASGSARSRRSRCSAPAAPADPCCSRTTG
ncbi:PIG-L family deacetylase [Clavibacter zhangzhiyongii]|uniref:PIG-L family deacetylase n=1 Tax=Clavibacter zhangzhiyongii TaxID=2768071 RepID=UPI0039E03C08